MAKYEKRKVCISAYLFMSVWVHHENHFNTVSLIELTARSFNVNFTQILWGYRYLWGCLVDDFLRRGQS